MHATPHTVSPAQLAHVDTATLSTTDLEKHLAAVAAVEQLESGMLVGLGTGSTSAFAVKAVARRLLDGSLKDIRCVPTSEATHKLALALGIQLITFDELFQVADKLDVTIDGADEATPELYLTKGGGGALLREKVVEHASKKFYVIADSSKCVEKLGAFPLPIEVVPFAVRVVERELMALGGNPTLRQRDGDAYVTDNGNYIFDCRFGVIQDPPALANILANIPGVAEHGLFIGMASKMFVGKAGKAEPHVEFFLPR